MQLILEEAKSKVEEGRTGDAGQLGQAQLLHDRALRVEAQVQACTRDWQLLIAHLAACKWDEFMTEKRLDELSELEFFDTQDYKMKLLQVWYRETSVQWYGKRGTSAHSAMWTFLRSTL